MTMKILSSAAKFGTLATVLASIHPIAHAHGGHGLSGAHWHATDVFGFVVAVAAVAAVLWWRGRK